ncbi:MAG: hypothetical protein U9P90_01680, partial [Patescibacteria group bacterium]|nr:hypothetical protein [Patescibacteria group bacterium]
MVKKEIQKKTNHEIKKPDKKSKKDLAKRMLLAILENTFDSVTLFVDAFEHPSIARGTYYRSDSKYEIKKEITRLKQKKFLEERKRGNRL